VVEVVNNLPGCNSVNEILGSVPLASLNSGLNDAWFNVDTDRQGFFMVFYPEIKQAFVSWFTFDTQRPMEGTNANIGEPGHRWLTAQGSFEENVAELEINLTSGGIFDAPQPMPTTVPYGEMTLEFATCNAGTVTYSIPSAGVQGEIPIERVALDNASMCYLLGRELGGTSANSMEQ
jgi:hypothetical protein